MAFMQVIIRLLILLLVLCDGKTRPVEAGLPLLWIPQMSCDQVLILICNDNAINWSEKQ